VPPVEPSVVAVIFGTNSLLVESLVVRVLERDVLQSLERCNGPVSDDLNLRLVGNRLQIRVQDGTLCV
jgi:hypothetical protein